MARYELTKKLETGNAIIDGEHRELFEAVNKLLDACSKGEGRTSMDETIKFLNSYVNQHFSHEEQLQRKSGYPDLEAHKAFHEQYKKTLKEITAVISSEGPTIVALGKLNGHISVLVSHISTADKKLGEFLNRA
ncbi:MAG: hemerythrin family protein [Lachnospiraceae bacterium]|nr:hemerythrin family protein [Lachnospiraceae bacterium]MDE7331952.1 hemerythrin family protein [Lachnospiraceae bacterium]